MKIQFSQLQTHLSRPLKPVWLVVGNEPQQMQEAGEAIRRAAVEAGFAERICIDTEQCDWPALLAGELKTLSLLSPKRLIETDLRTVRLTPAQGKSLVALLTCLPPDIVLLILAARPGAGAQPAWITACEQAGITLTVWPVTGGQLPGWIMQRARAMGLALETGTAQQIAKQTEGNLPAAVGILEKISLWCGKDTGKASEVNKAFAAISTDCSQHDIFQLTDAALGGHTAETLHILNRLWLSGTEPVLILWAIARDIRLVMGLHTGQNGGIYEKRKPLFTACYRRHTLQHCLGLLQQAAFLDRIIKGATDSAAKPDPRTLMEKLLYSFAGTSR